MGQQANSGRNASLDNKKARAAGRQDQEVRKQIQDAYTETGAKGRTGGAFGKKAPTPAKDSHITTNPETD